MRWLITFVLLLAASCAPDEPNEPNEPHDCPVTRPRAAKPPGPTPQQLFGAGNSFDNGKLWVGGLGDRGIITPLAENVEEDGSSSTKLGWWREVRGKLTITGRRLDGTAPPLRPNVPDGYGDIGFQSSGVYFPTEGCWEITGTVGSTSLTFVALVRLP